MERQRAPPKGREADNGSRGIDSRGRIPERLGIHGKGGEAGIKAIQQLAGILQKLLFLCVFPFC